MAKVKVETAKDNRQYVNVEEITAGSLNGVVIKLYAFNSDDSKYYLCTLGDTGGGGQQWEFTDVGSTPPTDGPIVDGP